jgi:DNA-binding NarL/FixJ family response regulator
MISIKENSARHEATEGVSLQKAPAIFSESEDSDGSDRQFSGSVAVVDSRTLTRECLTQSLKACDTGLKIVAVKSMQYWQEQSDIHPSLGAILLNTSDKELTPETVEEIRNIVSMFNPVPVLLLADSEDLEQIVLAMECDLKGYVPSSVGIAICAEAIRLAMVGGCYVPSSSIMALGNHIKRKVQVARPLSSMFTQRQAEVVQALRRGKANKIIAYELDMRESTVKVHIRNIMKKVKATNRTEVAYKINEMFPENA